MTPTLAAETCSGANARSGRGRLSRVLRGSVATGVAQPRRSSAGAFLFPKMRGQENMLVAYTVALDLIRALRPVVAQLRTYSPDAADQVERAEIGRAHV